MSDRSQREHRRRPGDYSVDDEDQLQPEDTLDDERRRRRARPRLLPHRPAAGGRSRTARRPTSRPSTRRSTSGSAQEVPDPDSAYGAPDNESGLDDDGRSAATTPTRSTPRTTGSATARWATPRAGRLVAADEGARDDDEKRPGPSDVGRRRRGRVGRGGCDARRRRAVRRGLRRRVSDRGRCARSGPSRTCPRPTCTCTSPARCGSRRCATWRRSTASGCPTP